MEKLGIDHSQLVEELKNRLTELKATQTTLTKEGSVKSALYSEVGKEILAIQEKIDELS